MDTVQEGESIDGPNKKAVSHEEDEGEGNLEGEERRKRETYPTIIRITINDLTEIGVKLICLDRKRRRTSEASDQNCQQTTMSRVEYNGHKTNNCTREHSC